MTLSTANGALPASDLAALKTELSVPNSMTLRDENVFTGHLNSSDQDTNDASFVYAWEKTSEDNSAINLTDPKKIVFVEGGNFLINAFIAIRQATARDRAVFYGKVVHHNADGSVKNTYKSSSTYIRGEAVGEHGGATFVADIVASAGEYVTIETVRLMSQDPGDDNPAHQTQSTIQVRRRHYSLAIDWDA